MFCWDVGSRVMPKNASAYKLNVNVCCVLAYLLGGTVQITVGLEAWADVGPTAICGW